jgi:hypothetical protein
VQFVITLKKELLKQGITLLAFSLNPAHGREWENRGMTDYVILPEYNEEVDIEWAADFARKLGIYNFRSLFQTEQIFHDLSENFCQKKFAKYIHSVEKLKNTHKARFYCTYGGDEFDHNVFRLYTRMQSGRSIYFQQSNMKNRIVLFENEDRYWKIPQNKISPPDANELKMLREYLSEYLKNKTILWAAPEDRDIRWQWNYIPRFFKRIKKSRGFFKDKPSLTNTYISKVFLKRLINRSMAERYYSDAGSFIKGETPFVYFPLHYPKDSQLTLRGKPFLNQLSIVETVSRYVPYPYTLLVKEHPHARGWYPASDIRKMAALPNVKLVHPFTNSHGLIPNAKAIVAINSSVGYEAIMYKKPVIAMGRSFYRGQGVTIDVDALYELETAFQNSESFALTEHDVLNFLWKIRYFSYESLGLFEKSKSNAINIATILSDFVKNNLN